MELNMEMKWHRTYNVMWWYFRVVIVALDKL